MACVCRRRLLPPSCFQRGQPTYEDWGVAATIGGMYRVMTFNVRNGMCDDGEHGWLKRRERTVEAIRRHRPAVVGVQEAFEFQVEYLHGELPEYRCVGVGREDGGTRGEYALLMMDEPRFEVRSSGQYWLSPTPEVPSLGWGARFHRIVTWVVLADRTDGRELVVLNTHWDHESELARRESARLMRERLQREHPGRAVVVMGDFNCTPGDPAYRELLGSGTGTLVDAYQAADRERGTFHAFMGQPQSGRIDWVLHSGEFRSVRSVTDRTKIRGLWPSDHFPVIVELEWV
jgi:endonuclease/exonuclease/phosphatase family metal-dependent hydrolase